MARVARVATKAAMVEVEAVRVEVGMVEEMVDEVQHRSHHLFLASIPEEQRWLLFANQKMDTAPSAFPINIAAQSSIPVTLVGVVMGVEETEEVMEVEDWVEEVTGVAMVEVVMAEVVMEAVMGEEKEAEMAEAEMGAGTVGEAMVAVKVVVEKAEEMEEVVKEAETVAVGMVVEREEARIVSYSCTMMKTIPISDDYQGLNQL